MNLFTWHPMSQPPAVSGTYLVGHRGTQAVRKFLAADRAWFRGTLLGWQGDMHFAPTHWMGFLDLEAGEDGHAHRMMVIHSVNKATQAAGTFR